MWRESRVWTVRLRESYDAKPRRVRLPMPGLVFVCLPARQPPYVFAATTRPRSACFRSCGQSVDTLSLQTVLRWLGNLQVLAPSLGGEADADEPIVGGGQAGQLEGTLAPRSIDDPLYHAPTYNVFPSGRVCVGTHAFPSDPSRVPEEFFRSYFAAGDTGRGNSQKYPDDIGRVWAEINGNTTYPAEDLVPQFRVGEALRIGT